MDNNYISNQSDIEDVRSKVLEILNNLEKKMITPETASRLAKKLEKDIAKIDEPKP